MDVDVIRKVTTEVDKEKDRTKGRCFNCGKQGHISCLCPDKKPRIATAVGDTTGTTNQGPAVSQPTNTVVSNEQVKMEDEKDTVTKVAKLAVGFNAKQQDELATKMAELGADFQ